MRIEILSGKPGRLTAYLLWPLVAAASCCYGGEENTMILAPAHQESNRDPGSATMTFRLNRVGQYTGTALINNVSMPFVIDTGATMTVIPKNMAASAKLPIGPTNILYTAGGRTRVFETKVGSLKVGNLEINNIDARLSEYMNFVLIGMNTLKHFRMTQTGDTLTLGIGNSAVVRNSKTETGESDVFAAEPLVKKSAVLKKTVICDENKVCKTIYSDH